MIELVTDWYCPNCGLTEQTVGKPNRYHGCPKLRMTAPLVAKGLSAKVEAKVREDYVGKENVRIINGKPVMSIVTTRDNGQDVIVFAPTATGGGSAG